MIQNSVKKLIDNVLSTVAYYSGLIALITHSNNHVMSERAATKSRD